MNLNAYQIADAFPDEAREFIPRILPVLRSQILDYHEKVIEIMNMPVSADDKNLYIMIAESMVKNETKDMIRTYEKVMELLNKDYSNDLTFKKSVEKAKTVPIERFYQFQRSRVTVNRIHASCPFHGEDKHPSFVLYRDSNTFHCFTCKISGDSIDFFSLIHKVKFTDAIKELIK